MSQNFTVRVKLSITNGAGNATLQAVKDADIEDMVKSQVPAQPLLFDCWFPDSSSHSFIRRQAPGTL
jgi:hypothetical protein